MENIEELRAIAVSMSKPLDKLLYEILSDAMKELDQYKNNWEELKKMFEADEHFEDGCYCSEILNKMKELEEDK